MLRYCLIKQRHFFADVDGNDTVVTIQHWQTRDTRTAIYVRIHDGVEASRKFARTEAEHALIERSFQIADTQFRDQMLSDDFAADEIARRGGPAPKWCTVTDCGAMVPYASAQCAEGHPTDHVNAGTYVFGSSRLPSLTVIQGGRK
jgi:hypothetical protein